MESTPQSTRSARHAVDTPQSVKGTPTLVKAQNTPGSVKSLPRDGKRSSVRIQPQHDDEDVEMVRFFNV